MMIIEVYSKYKYSDLKPFDLCNIYINIITDNIDCQTVEHIGISGEP